MAGTSRRARGAASIRRFRLYEKFLARTSRETANASFEEATEKACKGRVGLAERARKIAAFPSGLEAAKRAAKGG